MKTLIVLLIICTSLLILNFLDFFPGSDDSLIFNLSSFVILLVIIWLFFIRKNQSFGAGIAQLLILIFIFICRFFAQKERHEFSSIVLIISSTILVQIIIDEFRKSDA